MKKRRFQTPLSSLKCGVLQKKLSFRTQTFQSFLTYCLITPMTYSNYLRMFVACSVFQPQARTESPVRCQAHIAPPKEQVARLHVARNHQEYGDFQRSVEWKNALQNFACYWSPCIWCLFETKGNFQHKMTALPISQSTATQHGAY